MKILIVVEGDRTENELFSCLFDRFGIQAEIVVASNSLYSLYSRMKSYHFECDVKDAVKELMSPDKDRSLLDQKFAYTYLVFDSDLQNKQPNQRGLDIPIEKLVETNFNMLEEMAEYFTDETDPSIGRLYINYPMMESYRYCDSFSDESYLDSIIEIDKMAKFKSLASEKKLAGVQIQRYTKDNFLDLIRLNIRKLGILFNKTSILPYPEYQFLSDQNTIAKKQHNSANSCQCLSILNTSLLIIVDYFGNRNDFYNIHINQTKV